uniref:Uncharacterized protein n=1 Tax=Poecilia latipinna TaxID=48699 RepID=A0A3B3UHA6_9TELE
FPAVRLSRIGRREEHLWCCICLDMFSSPVTLPCGHNFCRSCIQEHLTSDPQRQCPMCKERVDKKHKLGVNTFISELAVQYRQSAGRKPGSCHQEPLELFCKNDQISICRRCSATAHRSHQLVPLSDEYQEKKDELGKTEARIQQVRTKITQDSDFNLRMIRRRITLEAAQAELIGAIEEKRRAREKQSQSLMADLEQEVGKLRRRQVQLQQLSRSSDPLVFLQSFPALNAVPPTKDWTQLRMCPLVYDGLTRTALLSATNQLTDAIRNAMQTLQDEAAANLHRSAVDVDLDPDTAHPALRLSDDRRRVQLGDGGKTLPYESKRFEALVGVLGRRGFACGRFHYDVQVKGKTAWTLGVARESVNRKVELDPSPENGFWTIRLQNRKEFVALASKPLPLSVGYNPDWVRVFVDYEEGQVSFYDVEAAVLLHSFTGFSFTEKLFPFFSPGPNDGGRNSAPLIIAPPTQHAEK